MKTPEPNSAMTSSLKLINASRTLLLALIVLPAIAFSSPVPVLREVAEIVVERTARAGAERVAIRTTNELVQKQMLEAAGSVVGRNTIPETIRVTITPVSRLAEPVAETTAKSWWKEILAVGTGGGLGAGLYSGLGAAGQGMGDGARKVSEPVSVAITSGFAVIGVLGLFILHRIIRRRG